MQGLRKTTKNQNQDSRCPEEIRTERLTDTRLALSLLILHLYLRRPVVCFLLI
jgi:hypothetical protein